MRSALGSRSTLAWLPRRAWVSAVAGLLFVAVFLIRLATDDPGEIVTLLYAVPIALLAVELGLRWGLGAAAFALGLFALWDVTGSDGMDQSTTDYLARATAFFVLGGFSGALADRLRRASAESDRFWELSSDMLCTAGFDGYFKRLNPAWERQLGWTLEELCSRPFLEFVHPDDRDKTAAEAANLTSAGHDTTTFQNRYRRKDGSYRSMVWSARSIPQDGLIFATAKDVTDSERSQDELRNSERFLDSVLNNLPNMVFVKDAEELRFVRFNRAGEDLIGLARDALIGKSDHDLFPKEAADAFVRKDREVLASRDVIDIPEEPLDTMSNGPRTLHTRKFAIRDEQGESRYLLGISEDITDRKAAEAAAEAARAEAHRANRAKSEFLSKMSHELRTPLNAVIGFGQLLELDDMDARQSEAVGQILKAGRHLLDLINEVLDISRIESGTMSISLEPVHLGSVLADALSLIRPLADEAQVRLIAYPSESADRHVFADQQRLKQVLINVLSNAVKYNRRDGEVSVRCTVLAEGLVELAIEDTGCGMGAEQLARLFEPFDRLGAESTDVEGTGLGLALSKGLMEAMGGAISAESQPGSGCTMRLHLNGAAGPEESEPAARTDAPAASDRLSSLTRTTIVYIEDNLSNLKLVERVLEHIPAVRLIPAMHGKLGLDLVRQHHPDLILLDLHLPDMHGREVLEQLKADPEIATIPVVVLSADATQAQLERLLAAGATGYLTKPIDVNALLDAVTSIAPEQAAAGEASSGPFLA